MSYFLILLVFCVVFVNSSFSENLTFNSQKCEVYRELRKLELTASDVNSCKKIKTKFIGKIILKKTSLQYFVSLQN